MPIVCACVPSYNVAVARHGDPALRDRPVIVADRLERGHAIDLDGEAFALGARTGMTLVQAAACAREAAIAVADPARSSAIWDGVLDALDAASPLVEDAAEGTAYLDMRGIEGSPQRQLDSVREALAQSGLPFRLGLASNPFTARAAALQAAGTVVAAGGERAFLAPLPLRVLDCDRQTAERLELLGISTLGDLAALPFGPFVRRFGGDAARWHLAARGIDDRPIVPRPRALRIDRALYGEGSADREDQLLFALRSLVTQVADDVAYAGKRAARLGLTLECEDASTHAIVASLARPTAQMQTMFDLLRAKLEGTTLHSPVIGLRLVAERLESGGSPLSLFAQHDPDPEAVAIAIARLDATLGEGRALRARVTPGFRAESRAAYDPFDPEAIGASRSETPGAEPVFGFRLLEPKAIGVSFLGGVPDRVDGRRVIDHAGPWRVDERWWRDSLAREEYDVLLADGALWRITREAGGWSLLGAYE
jgi:nucleotidyltransferase/DNA polymerase involved in DNA repair